MYFFRKYIYISWQASLTFSLFLLVFFKFVPQTKEIDWDKKKSIFSVYVYLLSAKLQTNHSTQIAPIPYDIMYIFTLNIGFGIWISCFTLEEDDFRCCKLDG